MKAKELRKARFEIIIAMLNDDPQLCKQQRRFWLKHSKRGDLMQTRKSLFFSQPVIIMRAKCDVCGNKGLCVYIQNLDKWYCHECSETVCRLLEILA